jgi:hypothetical protein
MKIKLSWLTFAVLLGFGSAARAERVGFSPSDCQMVLNAPPFADPALLYLVEGGGSADGSAEMWSSKALPGPIGPVICPITGRSNAITQVQMSVWDRHSTQDISCTLFMYNDTGGIVYSNNKHTVGANFTNPSWFTWSGITGGGKYGSISCNMPGWTVISGSLQWTSRISGYTAEEP